MEGPVEGPAHDCVSADRACGLEDVAILAAESVKRPGQRARSAASRADCAGWVAADRGADGDQDPEVQERQPNATPAPRVELRRHENRRRERRSWSGSPVGGQL